MPQNTVNQLTMKIYIKVGIFYHRKGDFGYLRRLERNFLVKKSNVLRSEEDKLERMNSTMPTNIELLSQSWHLIKFALQLISEEVKKVGWL